MKKIYKLYLLFLLAFFSVHTFAYDIDKDCIVQPMQPFRLVNDFAGMLNANELQQLETKLLDYNDSTSTQIYVVTVASIDNYSIEDYALRVARNWEIGQKNKNNGVLILLSKNERKVDIEVGYGLESYITDYDSKAIIEELIAPAFKDSNYYLGLDNACNRLMNLAQGTYANENEGKQTTEEQISWIWIALFLILVIYLMYKFPIATRIAFMILSSSGSSRGSSRGFGGGGGGSFGGGGSSGSW